MNKKPTYKELREDNLGLLICSFVLIACILALFFWGLNYEVKYNQLKYQLNSTEGKNYSCDFVGAIKPEDTRVCEDEIIIKMKGGNKYEK